MLNQVTQTSSMSRHNVLAQPTMPMNLADDVIAELARLSHGDQWIMVTANCPRPHHPQFSQYKASCNKIIQMMPSQTLSEIEVVMRAIQSGNASAVIASNDIDIANRHFLRVLAAQHQCEVFFVEGRAKQYH